MSPRTARLLKDHSFYHVIACGYQDQHVFAEEKDYQTYLNLMLKYKRRFQIKIYGFCLMPDHLYLVLRCPRGSQLSSFMQGVNQSYAMYFNSHYKRNGRLWRGRFKSVLLEKDSEIWECLKCIEFFPVILRITDSPANYSWSSYYSRMLGDPLGIIDQFSMRNVLEMSNPLSQEERQGISGAVSPPPSAQETVLKRP